MQPLFLFPVPQSTQLPFQPPIQPPIQPQFSSQGQPLFAAPVSPPVPNYSPVKWNKNASEYIPEAEWGASHSVELFTPPVASEPKPQFNPQNSNEFHPAASRQEPQQQQQPIFTPAFENPVEFSQPEPTERRTGGIFSHIQNNNTNEFSDSDEGFFSTEKLVDELISSPNHQAEKAVKVPEPKIPQKVKAKTVRKAPIKPKKATSGWIRKQTTIIKEDVISTKAERANKVKKVQVKKEMAEKQAVTKTEMKKKEIKKMVVTEQKPKKERTIETLKKMGKEAQDRGFIVFEDLTAAMNTELGIVYEIPPNAADDYFIGSLNRLNEFICLSEGRSPENITSIPAIAVAVATTVVVPTKSSSKFSCGLCKREFLSEGALSTHQTKVHSKKMKKLAHKAKALQKKKDKEFPTPLQASSSKAVIPTVVADNKIPVIGVDIVSPKAKAKKIEIVTSNMEKIVLDTATTNKNKKKKKRKTKKQKRAEAAAAAALANDGTNAEKQNDETSKETSNVPVSSKKSKKQKANVNKKAVIPDTPSKKQNERVAPKRLTVADTLKPLPSTPSKKQKMVTKRLTVADTLKPLFRGRKPPKVPFSSQHVAPQTQFNQNNTFSNQRQRVPQQQQQQQQMNQPQFIRNPQVPVQMTQTPMTQIPMTQTPMGQIPMTQTPMGQIPMTQTPMTQTPMGQIPITQTPMTPMTQTPMGQMHNNQQSQQTAMATSSTNKPQVPQASSVPTETKTANVPNTSTSSKKKKILIDFKPNYENKTQNTDEGKPDDHHKGHTRSRGPKVHYNFFCGFCHEGFDDREGFRQHNNTMTDKHKEISMNNGFYCEICNRASTSKRSYNEHLKHPMHKANAKRIEEGQIIYAQRNHSKSGHDDDSHNDESSLHKEQQAFISRLRRIHNETISGSDHGLTKAQITEIGEKFCQAENEIKAASSGHMQFVEEFNGFVQGILKKHKHVTVVAAPMGKKTTKAPAGKSNPMALHAANAMKKLVEEARANGQLKSSALWRVLAQQQKEIDTVKSLPNTTTRMHYNAAVLRFKEFIFTEINGKSATMPSAQLDEGNGDDCLICFEGFTPTNPKYKLSCGHSKFHSSCLAQMFSRTKRECPVCRVAV